MRLQRPLYTRKPVRQIRLRVITEDLPDGAWVDVTDLQLQPGEAATGVTVNPREAGTTAGRTQYRNGVAHDGMEIVALANIDRATPARLEVRSARGHTRIGSYRFGELNGTPAYADARTHRASHGHGRPPVVTARSDLYLRTKLNNRAHLRLTWEDREP
ncbi:hypothetical protein M3B43_07380 [Nesterenkonia massiliensis]|uniref:Uncharacterized protein n=1 Tax=Nesterenkonia massiliensis TaxID=1232429 RepID=A0ABT2HR20_9MICC|nr:hypothetical protein [Nesterenkonia massiliensis]MCT1607149.1 hypothetical protein [Nesterenkonia massiliensis]